MCCDFVVLMEIDTFIIAACHYVNVINNNVTCRLVGTAGHRPPWSSRYNYQQTQGFKESKSLN